MNRSLAAVALALAVLGAAPEPARAKVDARSVSFGIGGGVSVPVGDARSAFKTGFNGGAFVRLDLGTIPLALRADFTYQNFELPSSATPSGVVPGGGTGTLLAGLGDVQVYLGGGIVRPYLVAGLGAYSVRTEYNSDVLPTQTETRLGGHGGAGVLLTFGSLMLYAESTFDHIAARTGSPAGKALQVVPMTIGVIF